MKRNSHNGKVPESKQLLETIYSDISGPYNSSINGKKYFMTILDEYSRKLWIFTLKSKVQAPDIIIESFTYLNYLFKDYKIKNFKTDGGKEYNNKIVNKYCSKHGIFKSESPPYVHELNGKAERINQTIQNSAKTLLLWAGLSENFWNFAIEYSCFIYNKIPHQNNNYKKTNEVFTGKCANLKHVKVFGCVCYFKDYTQNKSKFAPKAKRGIFIGYSEKNHSYIILEPTDDKNRILYSTEVYFLEDEPSKYKCNNNGIYNPYFSFMNEYNIDNYNNKSIHTNNLVETNSNSNHNNPNSIEQETTKEETDKVIEIYKNKEQNTPKLNTIPGKNHHHNLPNTNKNKSCISDVNNSKKNLEENKLINHENLISNDINNNECNEKANNNKNEVLNNEMTEKLNNKEIDKLNNNDNNKLLNNDINEELNNRTNDKFNNNKNETLNDDINKELNNKRKEEFNNKNKKIKGEQ